MLNYRGNDAAFICEEDTRRSGITKILNNIPPVRDIDALIVVSLECIICMSIIPVERQQIILTIKTSCVYCAGCQDLMDRKTHATM